MKQPSPIELLTEKHNELKKALKKSYEAYTDRERPKHLRISREEHLSHRRNLRPLIIQYRQAIRILKTKYIKSNG